MDGLQVMSSKRILAIEVPIVKKEVLEPFRNIRWVSPIGSCKRYEGLMEEQERAILKPSASKTILKTVLLARGLSKEEAVLIQLEMRGNSQIQGELDELGFVQVFKYVKPSQFEFATKNWRDKYLSLVTKIILEPRIMKPADEISLLYRDNKAGIRIVHHSQRQSFLRQLELHFHPCGRLVKEEVLLAEFENLDGSKIDLASIPTLE